MDAMTLFKKRFKPKGGGTHTWRKVELSHSSNMGRREEAGESKSFALGLAAAQAEQGRWMPFALVSATAIAIAIVCCLQLHLHPASQLMKANLRINFKRICFAAVISRQRPREDPQCGEKK